MLFRSYQRMIGQGNPRMMRHIGSAGGGISAMGLHKLVPSKVGSLGNEPCTVKTQCFLVFYFIIISVFLSRYIHLYSKSPFSNEVMSVFCLKRRCNPFGNQKNTLYVPHVFSRPRRRKGRSSILLLCGHCSR